MKPKLRIVGGGMGGSTTLTQQGKEALEQSKRVLTTLRLGDSMPYAPTESLALCEITQELEKNQEDISVLVSGDTGFFSLSKTLVESFSEKYSVESIPGINSVQYLMARLNQSHENLLCLSLHGRNNQIIPAVSYNEKVFVLTGGENSVEKILKSLLTAGLEDLKVTIGQRLSYDNERIITDTPKNILKESFDPLSVMLIENKNSANPKRRLKDSDFARGKLPMTKEHARILSVDRLAIQPEDIVYDIGAGTGSVSVALALKANRGMVYAIEKSFEGIALIEENRKKFGSYNIESVKAEAPQGLEALPPPHKVFIGGSGGNLSSIIQCVLEKNKKAVFCINLVTLESLSETIKCFENLKFHRIEISCINCANAEKLGRYNLMKAENPIHIISGRQKW